MSGRTNVTIEHLVLRGFTAAEGRVAAARLRSELARLLSEPGARFGESRHMPRLCPAPLRPAEPGALGAAAAREIARGLLK